LTKGSMVAVWLLVPWPLAFAEETKKREAAPDPWYVDRIVTPAEVDALAKPPRTKPFLVLGWPVQKLFDQMEKGLIKFERGKIREKVFDFQRKLSATGFRPLFGGLGEGSGIGFGTVYEYPPLEETGLRLLGRMSPLSGYQEFAANFQAEAPLESSVVVFSNYQWRPDERYYGFGRDSSESSASSFALRQTSFGVRWEVAPVARFSFGMEYTGALLTARPTDGTFPSTDTVFGPSVPGLNERTELQSMGAFVDVRTLASGYARGGRAHFGASWQDGFGEKDLRYARIESRLEGHLPVVRGRSALIGQAALELTREARGTSPVPFYLYPRIGGSATLVGFPLDRFYGRNTILLDLEYRFAIHPNVDAQIFFDEGQVFQHTRDLSFLDWHRTYGFGFRVHSAAATQLRLELARGVDGFTVHLSFGDRPQRQLGGPVRYPLYRP